MNPPSALSPLGRWPLLFPLLGFVIGNLAAEFALWPFLVLLIVLGIYLGLLHRKPPLVAGAIAALLMAGWHDHRLQIRQELASSFSSDREVQLRGTLIESNSAGLVRRLFQTESGAKITLVNLPDHFQTGQKLTVLGLPIQKPPPRNPKGWEPEKTLWRRGIAGSLEVTSARATGWSRGFPALRGWSESIRYKLAQRLTTGIEDRSASDLVKGVILGEKASGSRAFDDFRKTGTMHIFAVSGLHVGLVALIIVGVGRTLRLHPRLLFWIVILSMFGYAFVTGLRPPALRASLMGSIFLGRFLLLRRPSVLNNLFAAALIVLIADSYQLWQTGFQLSFFVVIIILLLEPSIWKRVSPYLDHDPFLPKPVWTPWQRFTHWSRNKIGRMYTVSLAAWTGSAPLSLLHFGWFTPIAAFASVGMVMIAFLILAIASLSLVVGSLLPTAGNSLNSLNGHLALVAKNSAAAMGDWPGAWQRIDPPAPWQNGLCVFDIRYGGAAVHLDAGGGVLIDSGSETSFWWDVQPALEAHGLSCDSIIATHGDSQHIGGLTSAIRSYPVKQALVPTATPRNSLANLISAAREHKLTLHSAAQNNILTVDESTQIEILYPGNNHMSRGDDRGLVFRVTQNKWRILITADAGHETESTLLQSHQDLKADVWICGRNEKDSMGQDAFIRAVSPKVIIASEQSYPDSEQIPPSWRHWLEQSGISFFSQKEHGAIFILPSQNQLQVKSFLGDQQFRLKR